MWRFVVSTALMLAGCNSLLGIHDLPADAPSSSKDADPCTGTCECKVDPDCTGAHEVCVDMITSRTCQCAAGYTTDTTGTCKWSGVITNAGFSASGAWMTQGPAAIDATAMGMIDPGQVVVLDSTCTNYGGVTQSITMPRLSRAEPLVITSTYRAGAGNMFFTTGNAAVSVGAAWNESQPPSNGNTWVTARTCLGDGAYAPESTTGLGAAATASAFIHEQSCQGSFELDVDHAEIVPANVHECPDPGTVLDGDAEATYGWAFSTPPAGCIAGFVQGVGEGGTQGVRLFSQHRCDYISASVPFSVHADVTASPVLSLYHSTSGGFTFPTIDGHSVILSSATTDKFCLPPYMRGGSFAFAVGVQDPGPGTCSDIVNHDLVLDNLVIENDAACGTDPAIADPGFESGLGVIGLSQAYYGGAVRAAADGRAHGGARDLQFDVASVCGSASFQIAAVTPPATATAGPAVTFWYRYGPGPSTGIYASTYKTTFTPVRDGAWHQGVACLDPKHAGRPATLAITQESTVTGIPCGTIEPDESLAIDDLAVTTDPSCPTN